MSDKRAKREKDSQSSSFNLGLIGYPLGHSLSPKIHRAALAACGLEGTYALFPISHEDNQGLKKLLSQVRNREITGLNVTIPHKQRIIPLLDELTPTASAIGAVNTIFLKEDKLTGDNTDSAGFLSDLYRLLRRLAHSQDEKKAIILGAGGSARAVVYALINERWEVIISARRLEQARDLVAQFPTQQSQLSTIEYHASAFQPLLSTFSLIVNTTPIGMSPNAENSPYPQIAFPPNAAIYDLVYNPRETKLVKDARSANFPATTGLGMLVEQAALSFEIWTGCKVPRQPLFNALEKK